MSAREADRFFKQDLLTESCLLSAVAPVGCYKYVRPHTVFARVCLSEVMSTGIQRPETFLGFCCALAVLYAVRSEGFLTQMLETLQADLTQTKTHGLWK